MVRLEDQRHPSRPESAAPGRAETRDAAGAGHRRSASTVRSRSGCSAIAKLASVGAPRWRIGRVGLADGVEPLTRLLSRRRDRSAADGGVRARPDRRAIGAPGAPRRAQGSAAGAAGTRRRGARPDRRPGRRGGHQRDGAGAHQGRRADRARRRRPDVSAGAADRGRQARSLRIGAGSARTRRWPPRSSPTDSRCRTGGRSPTRCSASATRARLRRCWRWSTRPGASRRRLR